MQMNFPRDMVVYQIYPRSFLDTNGDGIGDLPGIISKLDYLQDLGVNALWLAPIYPSPDADNGYDIADYKAIHPHFGTMEDFDTLVAEAKKRGIRIIMDLVINHTSDEHAWFQKALAGDEKYRDYYIIRPGKQGKVPNNWGNFFGECPWTPFGDTGEYYLHLFNKKQPDLNWKNPAVLEEVKDILRFWLDKGVAGFRCDVINVLYKNTLKNGRPRLVLRGLEHYLSTEGCHEILRQLRKVLEEYGAFAVGESVFVDLPKAKDLTDPARKELDMVFPFEHMECDQKFVKWFKKELEPEKLMKCLVKWQTGLDWNAVYFENHDQPRFISRFKDSQNHMDKAAMMMAGIMMTLRGTPFIYQGQEIGMTNGDFAGMEDIQDVESHNVYTVGKKLGLSNEKRWQMIRATSRDNARTPMQWTAGENAGFTTGTPWLKVNANHEYINVQKGYGERDSVHTFWKYMIDKRKNHPVLREGEFRPVMMEGPIFAYERVLNGQRLLAMCNMSDKTVSMPLLLYKWDMPICCNYEPLLQGILRPYEFRLTEMDPNFHLIK